jgi:GNAT superfamily N-acetyltransferase
MRFGAHSNAVTPRERQKAIRGEPPSEGSEDARIEVTHRRLESVKEDSMDGSRRPRALETAWIEYVLTLDSRESVVVPIHAISSVQIHQLRELRLHAYLPEEGFKPLGRLYSVAETLGVSSKRHAWRLRIQDFFIEKELRGRGIGSQMLTLFLRTAEAEGCEYVSGELSSLDAIEGSVAHLVRFYERHGFKISPVPRPDPILATIRFDISKPSTSAVTKAQ